MTTVLIAPAGTSELHLGGVVYRTASDGTVSVPDTMANQALAAGCKNEGTLPSPFTTAKRPTAGLVPGLCIFDTTLGKPVWRNAANNGWVDATGTGA